MGNINLRRAVEGELARTIGTLPASVRRGSIWSCPGAACSAVIGQAHRIHRPPLRGARRSTGGRWPGSGIWWRPRCRDSRRGRHPGRRRRQPAGRAIRAGRRSAPNRHAEEYRAALENRSGQGRAAARAYRRARQGGCRGQCRSRLRRGGDDRRAYDPQSQVVRSTQTTEEASDQRKARRPTPSSAANNLPTERADARTRPPRPASAPTAPRKRSTTRSRARSATRPSGRPRCASCRLRFRSTASTATQPDGTRTYEPRGAEELTQLGGAGAQRSRNRREPRRRGRGREPAVHGSPRRNPRPSRGLAGACSAIRLMRFVELAVLEPVDPGRPVRGRTPGPQRLLRWRRRRRAASTAVVLGADGKPLLVHGATGATIGVDRAGNPVSCASRSRSAPGPAARRGQGRRPTATELVDLRSPRPGARLTARRGRKAIETSPEGGPRRRAWLHGDGGGRHERRARLQAAVRGREGLDHDAGAGRGAASKLFACSTRGGDGDLPDHGGARHGSSAAVVERLLSSSASGSPRTGGAGRQLRRHREAAAAVLDTDRVDAIMEEIRGPAGRTMWDKLATSTRRCSPTT